MREKRKENARGAPEQRQHQRFPQKHFRDFQARAPERFEDADLASAFQDHCVHVEEHNQKTDDDADAHHRADKGFQLRKIGRIHKRHVFGHGADEIVRRQLENFLARGFRVALATHIEHRDAVLRAGNVLRGL